MLQVVLKDVRFHAYHGLHEEEAFSGGEFRVNLVVAYEPTQVPVTGINQTVDYTQLFELVKRRMKHRTALLETLATEIALEILEQFELVQQVDISIDKINPPITNFQGGVGVSYQLKRTK